MVTKSKEGESKFKKKNSLVTIFVVIAVVVIAGLIIYFKFVNAGAGVSDQLAKCIGQHSQLYVQLGCHFCAQQEQIFGKSVKYLNITDCYYNPQECNSLNIPGTPTWIINGKYYLGVQSLDKLKRITGC